MTKLGEEIIEGLTQAIKFMEGDTSGAAVHQIEITPMDIKAVRKRLGLTQARMALLLGVSVSGYRKWEQGERQPGGAARTLLRVMAKEPEAVMRSL